MQSAMELRDIVLAMPRRWYAVLDGALFDDLPNELRSKSMVAKSLFRDHEDSDVERAGPWLAQIHNHEMFDALQALANTANQAWGVFWSCELDDEQFLQHLRTLNMVLLPNQKTLRHEAVMFRHWDPNSLAIVIEILDKHQLTQLLGPAQRLVFCAPDFGGIFQCAAGERTSGGKHG